MSFVLDPSGSPISCHGIHPVGRRGVRFCAIEMIKLVVKFHIMARNVRGFFGVIILTVELSATLIL